MTLPPARLDRFARHIVLPEIGGAGQVALASAHVALIGLGGIGAAVAQKLLDRWSAATARSEARWCGRFCADEHPNL